MMQPARLRRLAGIRTLAAIIASVAFIAALAFLPDDALAGRYEVVQCDGSNPNFADATFDRVNGGDYGFRFRCQTGGDESSLQIRSITGAEQGRFGRIAWMAPAETRIVGVEVDARMRSDSGHQARLSFLDGDGGEVGRIATGSDSPSGFKGFSRQLDSGGRMGFGAILHCGERGGCPASEQARNWVRSVDLTLDDGTRPAVALAGPLVAGGWNRGEGALRVRASDGGSGVRRIDVRVNGTSAAPTRILPCSLVAGGARATRLRPCPAAFSVESRIDTTRAPFADGVNSVRLCASDYGTGPVAHCVERRVLVDNAPPEVAFSPRDPADPELITATAEDRHSGLALTRIAYRPIAGGSWNVLPTSRSGGESRARVDSLAERPGLYAFRVVAVDRAGNYAVGTKRRDGSDMVLEFPLREPARLSASIGGARDLDTGYGERPWLEAVLRGPDGPLAHQKLDVIERFATGSSLEPLSRTVETDSRGRIRARLTRGPSRIARVAFSGSRRYGPVMGRELDVRVRGEATIEPFGRRIRAGRRVAFRGSIGAYGAAIPKGKLVELQVRGGGLRRFRTVGRAFRTDRRGEWRFRYRFDRFYERPTRFRFRLKVSRERSFPYRTPAFSKARSLTVAPRP